MRPVPRGPIQRGQPMGVTRTEVDYLAWQRFGQEAKVFTSQVATWEGREEWFGLRVGLCIIGLRRTLRSCRS